MRARSEVPRAPVVPLWKQPYDRSNLRRDVLAGITVAAYLVPQVMAYGEVAGLQAVAGLYAIIPALALYAVLGSSRQLSVGPESTTALMTAVAIGPIAAGQAGSYAALAALSAVLVGLICLVAWALRLGFIADLLSRPILVGYMAGVAIIMAIGQLQKITGIPVSGESIKEELASAFRGREHFDPLTFGFAMAVLAMLLVIRWRWPRLPGPLIAVLCATAVVAAFDLGDSLALVGELPGGLPVPQIPVVSLDQIMAVAYPALGIAVVGYSDNVLTARAYANRNNYTVDANQELLALGSANIGAGFFQGFPVSSSGSRTALGDASGSRTQVYSLAALVSVIVVIVALRDVLAAFPKAALGALVIYAAILLIDIGAFRRLLAFRRDEFMLAMATFAGVLTLGLLNGIIVAIGLSLIVMLAHIARPNDAVLGTSPGIPGMHDIDDYPDSKTIPGLVVYRYDSPLFFANAEDFRARALEAVASDTSIEWLVLNAEAVTQIDSTAADSLNELIRVLRDRSIRFGIARAKHEILLQLQRAGTLDLIDEGMVFATLPTAVEKFRAR